MTLLRIEWIDSAGCDGWTSADHAKAMEPSKALTVGILLSDMPDHITVASSYGDNDRDQSYSGVMCIPRKCIVKVEEVKA